jgi:hypothetical protein
MGTDGYSLKQGKDGLTHVALDDATICGVELLSLLGSCDKPTCVACIAGIVTCACGAPSELTYCGYDQEIHGRDTVCRCCNRCAKHCYENV